MLQASDKDAVAVCDPGPGAGAMNVVKRQFKPRKEEDVEQMNCFADREIELAHSSREEHDGLARLLLLLRPRTVEARVCSEVSDGLIVG